MTHGYSRRFTVLAVLCLLLFSVGGAYADNSKISPDLLPLLNDPSSQVNVIIQYNSSPTTCSGGGLITTCKVASAVCCGVDRSVT